jgi:hypothetical protein
MWEQAKDMSSLSNAIHSLVHGVTWTATGLKESQSLTRAYELLHEQLSNLL